VAVRRGETDTWWVIPALEAEDVGVSLAWLGEGDSDYRADACDRTGRAIKETDASVEDGILRVSFVPDASVVKYRIRVRPTKTRLPFT